MSTPAFQSALAHRLRPECRPRGVFAARPSPARHPRSSPTRLRALLAGGIGAGTQTDFALARWLPSGQIDGSFNGDGNNDGKITTDFVGGADYAWGLAISPDGKMLASGHAYNVNTVDFALARYNPNGSLDDGTQSDTTPGDTFGDEGRVLTDAPGEADAGQAFGCALQPADNKILVVGWAWNGPGNSDFMVARYLPGEPDIQITGFRVDLNDPTPEDPTDDLTRLEVMYTIWNSPVGPFDIAVYASFDGQSLGTLLIDHFAATHTTVGRRHTTSTPAVLINQAAPGYDLELDYFLMAKVDSQNAVVETNELNNAGLFEGGIFLDDTHHIVHVHGVDDPAAAAIDVVTLGVQKYEGYAIYSVQLNDLPVVSIDTREQQVEQFHVRTHLGDDSLRTPFWYDPHKVNQSGFDKVIWAFGGNDSDALFGGAEADRLYGGPGDDLGISGREGDDVIHGGPGNDTIEGQDGNDQIYGEGGNDFIEGWGNEDIIYGDYHHDDPLSGTDDGDDIITGGATPPPGEGTEDEADEIYGGGGNDRIDGWKGNDTIYGDYHPDDPHSDPEHELYTDRAGNDEIYGWTGDDWIEGGPGDDNLFGEQGGDTIYGGSYDRELAREIVFAGDDDWIFPDLEGPPLTPAQDIDLVTDIDKPLYGQYGSSGIEPWPGSEDNREENGFYGGRYIYVTDDLADNLMQIYVNDPFDNDPEKRLTGKQIVLNWQGDAEVIKVYLDPQKTTRIQPGYSWTITDPWEPISIYVEAVDGEGTGVVQTSMTLTLDPDPGDERPLSDFMFLTVSDDVE